MSAGVEKNEFIEFKLSGISSEFLIKQSAEVMEKSIGWDTFFKANLISQKELETINRFDKASLSDIDLKEYVELLLSFLSKIVKNDAVQYILCSLDEAFIYGGNLNLSGVSCVTLVKQLSKTDEFVQLKAAKVIAEFISGSYSFKIDDLLPYFEWINSCLNSTKGDAVSNTLDVALQCLLVVLRRSEYRQFFNKPEYMNPLVELLKNQTSPQVTYQIICCLWLLSFISQNAAELETRYHILAPLVSILKNAIKEKVTRVCLLTLRNMLLLAPSSNVLPMVGHKIEQTCNSLNQRKWNDTDIKDELTFLETELHSHIQSLSTWEKYVSELKSGVLECK